MKQVLLGIFFCLLTIPAYAANSSMQGGGQQTQVQQQLHVSQTPTGAQIQNRNQVQTQNQGEESSLMVQTSEQEQGSSSSQKGNSQKTMDSLTSTETVLDDLTASYTMGNATKTKIQEVISGQLLAHDVITNSIASLDAKPGFAKFLTGADTKALKNLQGQVEQNRVRIEKLMQLKTELYNAGDLNTIQEAIEALVYENTALEEKIMKEQKGFSLFGWLIRLF